ncbi:hypothetical protein MASR1M68_12640 [Elusimicrobiota bacterium]
MNKILGIKYLSFLVFGIVITFIAVFNSFMYVGLIEDGAYRFFEALSHKNFILGSGGFPFFPYNLRYFSSMFSHLAVGLSINYLDIINIKYLLYIFTFVSYFKVLIILGVIYLNLPKNKKQVFEIILFSFLLTFVFTIYQVWGENVITGLFIWVLFVIFYYVDFDKLTVFNKFCIVIFSLMLISSHQMVLIFIPILLIIAVKKHISVRNLKLSSEIALRISYILLLIAMPFNFFSAFDMFWDVPSYSGHVGGYASIKYLFSNTPFFLTCVFIMLILILSVVYNDKKNDNIKYLTTGALLYIILKLLLLKLPTESNFSTITLGFHIPLLFLILLICIGFFKIKIKYKYIRLINFTLCMVIYINAFHYGLFWKQYLTDINQYIVYNKKITVDYSHAKEKTYPILMRGNENEKEIIFPESYHTNHSDYILYILIFMEGLFGKYSFNDFVSIKTLPGDVCNDVKNPTRFLLIKRKANLKKIGIDIDSFIKVNNTAILK